MAALPQRPQRPTPATLQEKYFIEAVDMLWCMMDELRGIRDELRAIRNTPQPSHAGYQPVHPLTSTPPQGGSGLSIKKSGNQK